MLDNIKMSELLYRIMWKNNKTGVTGNGEYCLSFDDGISWIEELNKKYKNVITHWIEARPLTSSQPLESWVPLEPWAPLEPLVPLEP